MNKKLLLTIYLLTSACTANAVAPSEDEIQSITVKYAGGSGISVNCSDFECNVRVSKEGKVLTFSPKELGAYPFPSLPVLFSVNFKGTLFQIELDCEQSGFSDSQRGRCMGDYTVENGKIVEAFKFRQSGVHIERAVMKTHDEK